MNIGIQTNDYIYDITYFVSMEIILKKIIKRLAGRKIYSFLLNTPLGQKIHDNLHENSTSSRDFLLQSFPKNSIGLEIGVNNGGFSERILEIVRPKKLHLIDPWKFFDTDSMIDTPYGKGSVSSQLEMDKKFENVKKRFSNEILNGQIVLHRGFSDEIMPTFEKNYFDWVYVDWNHLYDYVKKDLQLCYEKTKDHSLITGDDYYNELPDEDWSEGGVKKAVDEFINLKKLELIQIKNHQFISKKI